jgi:hypothetical protein
MKNVIVIGLNPTKLAVPRKGGAWHRFQEWLDYLGIDKVSFTNISPDPHWDKKQMDTTFLKESISEHAQVIAWGPSVSKYLTKMDVEHFVLPHPSPLNRQINDRDFINRKLDECKEYLNV